MTLTKGRAVKPSEGFVLDNSVAMAWSFEDEADAYADAVLNRLTTERAIVPVLGLWK